MRKQQPLWQAQKVFEGRSFSEFEHLMRAVFQRMEVSLPPANTTPPTMYQLKFPDGAKFFISEKSEGWFEIATQSGVLSQEDGVLGLVLLSLQRQQGEGPLVAVGMNPENRLVCVYARLRAGFCYPEDVIHAIKLVRARSLEVHALLCSGS